MRSIQIENIYKKYQKKCVLQHVSLQAEFGSCVGILGSNGSGKSTLLSILAGITSCRQGSFICDEKDLLKDSAARNKLVAYVPQGTPLIEELSARDNLSLWYTKEELKQELNAGTLAMLGIPDFIHVPVSKMSGGMKKRLSIGCAVASKPEILLLDEPSAALDLICKEHLYRYIDNFKRGGGLLLLTTHDIQELSLCDALYILKDGSLHPYSYDGDLHHLTEQL